MKNRTFTIYTLGCKLNFSESSDISRRLRDAGLEQSDIPDVIIVNSCAVTASAVKKTRNTVARLHRKHPDAQIVLTGCYAALQPVLIKQWEGVSAVFGSEDKLNVIPYILGEPIPDSPEFFSTYSSGDRTRSFLKIQDGCDYHCSYCTVALARGKSRSDSIDGVLSQLTRLSHLGVKEVNLTGVNIGDFGKLNDVSFFQLLKEIDALQAVDRIRISSIEPDLLKDESIELISSSETIMPHFHIPLQSGSNRILNLMRRRYQRELFEQKILKIKELMPEACIAIDIISGFPTESDEDFEDSYQFISRLPISYMHVFTYSKRANTPAATMPQVQDIIKKERTNRLLALSSLKKEQFYKEAYGTIRPVLFESDNDGGFMYGFTDNYLKVKAPYQADKTNTIIQVEITPENCTPSVEEAEG